MGPSEEDPGAVKTILRPSQRGNFAALTRPNRSSALWKLLTAVRQRFPAPSAHVSSSGNSCFMAHLESSKLGPAVLLGVASTRTNANDDTTGTPTPAPTPMPKLTDTNASTPAPAPRQTKSDQTRPSPHCAGAPCVGGVSLDGGSPPVAICSRHVLRGSFPGLGHIPKEMRRVLHAAGIRGVGIRWVEGVGVGWLASG